MALFTENCSFRTFMVPHFMIELLALFLGYEKHYKHVHFMDIGHKTRICFIWIIFFVLNKCLTFSENLLKCTVYFSSYPCIFVKTINIHFFERDNAQILCNAHFGNGNLVIYHYEFHAS